MVNATGGARPTRAASERFVPSLFAPFDARNGGGGISARLEVYYDGWCPICMGAKDRLARLDRRGRLAFRSMREPGVAEQVGVPATLLAARMHARSVATGRIVSGITALRWVAAALPSLWPSVPLLWLAEKIGVGVPLYDWVAARRPIIPVGHCEDGACPIHQPKP